MNDIDPDILSKLQRFCAYQDRCRFDIKKKLTSFQITHPEDIDRYIEVLEDESFLDEDRFTEVFVRSKFKSNQWGKLKIRAELQGRQIPSSTVNRFLNSTIPSEAYLETAQKLFSAKYNSLKPEEEEFSKKQKSMRYLASKGFESDIVMKVSGMD